LFHPIRVAITAAESGPELDLAVPAIDRGAALAADAGLTAVLSCAERLRRVAERLGQHPNQNPGTAEPRNPGTH
jgi:hypothetical protein